MWIEQGLEVVFLEWSEIARSSVKAMDEVSVLLGAVV